MLGSWLYFKAFAAGWEAQYRRVESRMARVFWPCSCCKDGMAINCNGETCGRSSFGGMLRNLVLDIFKCQGPGRQSRGEEEQAVRCT